MFKQCEKLRKKRSSLVGAFVSTHGKSIDDVDRSIVEARTSLNEVTQELQERVHRWKQIELLCGFNIVNNSGLQFLESTLYRGLYGRGLRGNIFAFLEIIFMFNNFIVLCLEIFKSRLFIKIDGNIIIHRGRSFKTVLHYIEYC